MVLPSKFQDSIMASATRAASALRHSTSALEARACEDSDVMLRGHTGPRWYARPMLSLLGFRIVRRDGRIHTLGRFHIGGVAYCVWALPPKAGATAHRHDLFDHNDKATLVEV